MFNIGDRVYYQSEELAHNYYGIVTKAPEGRVTIVQFETDFAKTFGPSKPYAIETSYIRLDPAYSPEDTARTPVQRRIRKLWNASNYVINNPTQSY